MKYEPVIVIIGYNREESLERLLNSVKRAKYPHDDIRIIISLDGGASDKVVSIADNFKMDCKVFVVKRAENIGLREHVIWAGSQSYEYDSVIVLEDDLEVDPWYYYYSCEVLNYYHEDENIAGVSLYSQCYNEYAALPFNPVQNGKSTYFMKVPSSWGQAWTKKQWDLFKSWYDNIDEDRVDKSYGLPKQVKNWPKTSWKKFFACYCVEVGKYFVYPYISYTTNFSDPGGVHMKKGSAILHVEMPSPLRQLELFDFCSFSSNSVRYDAYMEPEHLIINHLFEADEVKIAIDLFGIKPLSELKEYDYVLTSKKGRESVFEFDVRRRPIEINFIESYSELNIVKCEKGLIRLMKVSELKENHVREGYYSLLLYYYYKFFCSRRAILKLLTSFFYKY